MIVGCILLLFVMHPLLAYHIPLLKRLGSHSLKQSNIPWKSFSTAMLEKPVVKISKGKETLFTSGNPLIYNGSIQNVPKNVNSGDEVFVCDYTGDILGRGIYNLESSYRVRMFTIKQDQEFEWPIEKIIELRIENAFKLRKALNMEISSRNTVYRLVNGEGDRLGGLMIDVMGDFVVCQSGSHWSQLYQSSILQSLEKIFQDSPKTLLWKPLISCLKQDGVTITELPDSNTGSFSATANVPEDGVVVYENGLQYRTFPGIGQKTGFYADQRDNRQLIQQLSKGSQVLDLYCYSGGFGINSLVGGASSVTFVDSSSAAIDTARHNVELNRHLLSPSSTVTFLTQDCSEACHDLLARNQQFDMVICDPPKLAPTIASLPRAKRKYIAINTLAMQLVRPGGFLLTCSCSGAVANSNNGEEMTKIIREAAKRCDRDVTILSSSSAALDHPVALGYSQGRYLTAFLLRIL